MLSNCFVFKNASFFVVSIKGKILIRSSSFITSITALKVIKYYNLLAKIPFIDTWISKCSVASLTPNVHSGFWVLIDVRISIN